MAKENPLASIIADPSALGLFGFAVTTFVAASLHAKWYTDVDNGMFSAAICYGGVAQILAGLIDLLRGVKIGGSTFIAFGLYWFSQGLWMIPSNSLTGLYDDMDEAKKIKATYILGFAAVAVSTTIAELRSSYVKIVLLILVCIDFTCLSLIAYTSNLTLEKVTGYILLVTAILAWYLGTACLCEGSGVIELPIGKIGNKEELSSKKEEDV